VGWPEGALGAALLAACGKVSPKELPDPGTDWVTLADVPVAG
jgi:hypothetical protein